MLRSATGGVGTLRWRRIEFNGCPSRPQHGPCRVTTQQENPPMSIMVAAGEASNKAECFVLPCHASIRLSMLHPWRCLLAPTTYLGADNSLPSAWNGQMRYAAGGLHRKMEETDIMGRRGNTWLMGYWASSAQATQVLAKRVGSGLVESFNRDSWIWKASDFGYMLLRRYQGEVV
ncbi:hypothetical protein NM208_g15106 [Fusarium decemcellulare]|uniref:Uncharacterized protein n=1 Tax=Fusarium decemcellulare TaxID=57161 RepID=A0ACC1RDZ8_9HYPO|nr:hypothetical protein NM208_g15106 [Fusarium decemcellulare]